MKDILTNFCDRYFGIIVCSICMSVGKDLWMDDVISQGERNPSLGSLGKPKFKTCIESLVVYHGLALLVNY